MNPSDIKKTVKDVMTTPPGKSLKEQLENKHIQPEDLIDYINFSLSYNAKLLLIFLFDSTFFHPNHIPSLKEAAEALEFSLESIKSLALELNKAGLLEQNNISDPNKYHFLFPNFSQGALN